MAPKRGRQSKDSSNASITSKKRRKVDGPAAKNAHAPRELVNGDQLDWKAVDMPDLLEDAEGFFGLEEIDGVDIETSGGGELKFKASEKSIKKRAPKGSAESFGEDDGDEWEGFSDKEQSPDEPKANDEEPLPVEKKEKPKKAKAANKADKNKKAKPQDGEPQKDSAIQASIPFSALADQDDEGVDVSAWESLDLHPELQTSLSRLKFTKPTPIQLASIPEIIAGRDVIGKASTGSGKTLAFGIPIIQHYLDINRYRTETSNDKPSGDDEKIPTALILSPTRELAHQIVQHMKDLVEAAPHVNAMIASVTGGLSIYKQQRLLVGADIIVGTPGRLWDVISSTPNFLARLRQAKFLVIDEADRLLSEGHFKEVTEILAALDRVEKKDEEDEEEDEEEEEEETSVVPRQTLVFSATFHKGLQQKLARRDRSFHDDLMDKKDSMEYLLRKVQFADEKPEFIDANPISQMAENLKEGIVECGAMEKDLYLYALLLFHPNHRTLVFTNSISAVRRITNFLQNLTIPAMALHSSMAQKARMRSIERFSKPTKGVSTILVATDIAARGLDISGVDLVIHYHVPRTADTYVHRSGRTARAEASGKSILISSPEETAGVARLVAKVHSQKSRKATAKTEAPFQSIDLDRHIIGRLRPRANLSKRITESILAKEKVSSEGDWLRTAAEDLGVDYDSEEFAEEGAKTKGRGRGGGREAREKKASNLTKAEMGKLKAQLRDLLSKRLNVGVSEKYLTSGRVDIDALLRGETNAAFLGHVDKLDF